MCLPGFCTDGVPPAWLAALRTVVNKVGAIETEFRVFRMEVIAGEPSLQTTVRQHGCSFHLNFSEVYWNSRLEKEHARMVEQVFQPSESICDMMCGIGPFAVPAGKSRGCRVLANDLNPRSFHWLKVNIAKNKVPAGKASRPEAPNG